MGRKHKHKSKNKNVEKQQTELKVSEETEKELLALLEEKIECESITQICQKQEIRKKSHTRKFKKFRNPMNFENPKTFDRAIKKIAEKLEIHDDIGRIFGFYLDISFVSKKKHKVDAN